MRKTCVVFVGLNLLAVSTLVAQAQTPLLKLAAAPGVARSRQVTVTNTYSAPVTAYVITEAGPPTPRGPRRIIKWADSIPSEHGLHPDLPPGGSAIVNLPNSAGAVTNLAVIYADGASAGQPQVIAHLLRARQYLLAELPNVVAQLHAVAADPGAERSALLADFQARTASAGAVLNDGPPPMTDRVTATVATTLRQNPNQNLQATANALAVLLFRWQRQLETSLPRLASTPAAPSSPSRWRR